MVVLKAVLFQRAKVCQKNQEAENKFLKVLFFYYPYYHHYYQCISRNLCKISQLVE